jgi:hypothetical protein
MWDRAALVATLWTAALFIGVAIAGYLLLPRLAIVWGLLGAFGAMAVPQAFLGLAAARCRERKGDSPK